MLSWFLLMVQLLPVLRLAVGLEFSLPNCVNKCGDVKIPYPFGIGVDCYYNQSYEITCNTSSGSPKPFLHQFNLEVLNIDWPGRDSQWSAPDEEQFSNYSGQTLTVGLPRQNLCESTGDRTIISHDFRRSPYRFSTKDNSLKVEGCGISAAIKTRNGKILTGCASICVGDTFNKTGTTCDGIGCCTASVPDDDTESRLPTWDHDLDFYEIDVVFEQLTDSISCNASVAFIDTNSMENYTGSLSSLATLPTTLRWKSTVLYPSCRKHYYCGCWFFCDSYLSNECQGKECQNCLYNCGIGDTSGEDSYYHYKYKKQLLLAVIIILGGLPLILGSYSLYRFVKRKREIKRKAKHFKRNGGLLLQQQMSSNEGVIETTKVFTVTELENATDNFNDNRILGQGGQGMVHKGMLIDGKIVAIKTAKKVDESQVEQFINEVVILSQINHRNVVKILGCCLETEVPILVYEFIPNGTLYELIHDQSEEFHLNWKMRLQIAAESAGAVAYLHSSSSAPIYHRDIKSTNILLDEKYRAKVSDFGTSKAINIDQTHVTTIVLGTYGYLDPEYFQSNQFTEKSDVYSFGVVLVELITGKKPICPTGNGGWINLATEFLDAMEDAGVLDMLDVRIVNEGKEDEFMAIAELARKCLNMNGKRRPTMKEIAVLLDGIRFSHMPELRVVNRI